LDDFPTKQIETMEKEFYPHLDAQHADTLNDIAKKKEITDKTKEKLEAAIKDFLGQYQVEEE
ncbi:unnamed protein product, partial [marine sediment metagenome]